MAASAPPVLIARARLAAVLAHAAAEPGREVCGLLFGDDTRIVEAVAARNVAPDPTRWFEVDPAVLIAAMRAERTGGPRLIGHYHSHPGGVARPSPRDLAAAEPGRLWLIVGGGVARLWRARDGRFDEVVLRID